jgi:hypothetical protein
MAATNLFSKQMSIVLDGSTMGCATDFSLAVNKDIIEIACLGSSGAKMAVPDMYGWSVSFSGMVMQTKTKTQYGYEELMAKIQTDASIGVYILPDVSANTYYSGAGYLTTVSMEGGVGAPVTFSGEITGSGALTTLTTV